MHMHTNFMAKVADALEDNPNISVTENGALGYKHTDSKLVDMNFAIPQLRTFSDDLLISKWDELISSEEISLVLRWLFFLRDVRYGVGERETFRRLMKNLCNTRSENARMLIKAKVDEEYLIPFYGRWDDLLCLFNTYCRNAVAEVIHDQLEKDLEGMKKHNSISLLAKWMPSINTSSKEARKFAWELASYLDLTPRAYRKMLSALRKHLDVVERKMSGRKWDEINYEGVPSKANLIYSSAFLTHDAERRTEYLESLKKGEAKINSSVSFPHEIIHAVDMHPEQVDTYDAMWKSLPNLVDPNSRTMVVVDGSGSMCTNIPGSGCTAMEVSNAIGIYFAERLAGEFKNKFITFGGRPQYVDFTGKKTILEKWRHAERFNDCSNTNIEAVFMMVLNTAKKYRMRQDEMPANLLFISDMEFDAGVDARPMDDTSRSLWSHYGYNASESLKKNRLMDNIDQRFRAAGYRIPRMIFWNVNSRTGTIPVTQNDLGVVLISGYSMQLAKMVMSANLDPYECLVEQLTTARYDPIKRIADSIH